MLAEYKFSNYSDENGNPAGGYVEGVGLYITWQNGPLGTGADRKEPNGAFVETVLDSVRNRLEHYQSSKFKCTENMLALVHIEQALKILNERTKNREARMVEGTHAV